MAHQVLIVDDQPGILATLTTILEDEGYQTLTTGSGEEALELYRRERPDVVFLDIWLPDRDGLETLEAIRRVDSDAAVVMISGHGTTSTAVRAMKMGALDYIEKPLSYERVIGAVESALDHRVERSGVLVSEADRVEPARQLMPPPRLAQLRASRLPQRTIRKNTVIYGLGLHSGTRTGMVLQPLPVDTGIHFLTIPSGTVMPAHVSSVADTDYATTLSQEGENIRTVEHLLSALHAAGVTNLLIKVHGEIPVLDGSAVEFCRTLQEVGVEDQAHIRQELVVDRPFVVGSGEKKLVLEPYDGFAVSYRMRYPAPVGEQSYEFELTSFEAYVEQIAPARTFGFMRDLAMLNELGLGSGGRLDNFILVGEDNVINTSLRFPEEFARHKILDIIGDLYLLGYPIRGKVTAGLTGHRDNIAVLRAILAA
jgi:UDP-3-O-[3-hydroxymyristoyl] N-acetylglucosamine deacetylase